MNMGTSSRARVAFVPHNTRGRDFVVGDVHGCRRDLEILLVASGFNPARGDRLFSTGDLIDRGADSFACLKLLRQPWFYAVLGNHEQMLFNALESGNDNDVALCMANGGSWALGLLLKRDPELTALAQIIGKLPHVLVVGPGTPERFNVVHASLQINPTSGRFFTNADIDDGLRGADEHTPERLIWSRTIADEASIRAVDRKGPSWHPGLSITYCGHNPVPYPVIYESHCHLDTGSGYEGNVYVGDADSGAPMRLTLADHNKGNPVFYTR